MRGEKCLVPQVPPAPYHRQVHADLAALHVDRDHVGIAAAPFHGLLVQHAGQRRQLVAQGGGLLETHLLRRGEHPRLDIREHGLGLAAQELRGPVHVQGVVRGRDQPHARPGAAMDLIEQTGPRPVGEDRVLAGAQAENLLQDLYALAHRPYVGERAEILVGAVRGPAVVGDAGEGVAADLQVGIGLVVAEQDVVARRQRLDQVVFQQQGLGLGPRHGDLDARHPGQHMRDARAAHLLLEIRRHPLLQIPGLADVHHLAFGVDVPVHAGQVRKLRQEGLDVEDRRSLLRDGRRGCLLGRHGHVRLRRRLRRLGVVLLAAGHVPPFPQAPARASAWTALRALR